MARLNYVNKWTHSGYFIMSTLSIIIQTCVSFDAKRYFGSQERREGGEKVKT